MSRDMTWGEFKAAVDVVVNEHGDGDETPIGYIDVSSALGLTEIVAGVEYGQLTVN